MPTKDLRMSPDNSLDFAATRVQHTPMRLLIIEDDRDAADYLVKAFREVGHVADWSRRRRGRPRARARGRPTTC